MPKFKKPDSKHALIFIFITLVIDSIGIGIVIPVVPLLLETLGNFDISHAAKVGGYMTFAYSITEFLFAPVMGGLSDRFGRRPILLFALTGLGIDYLFLAAAPTITLLFIGRVFAGFCGASYSPASAYIADITKPEERAKYFGMMGAAFGLGFIFGPAIGGYFAQFGYRVPFIVAAVLALSNVVFGYFILPESLAPELRRKFDWRRANPLGSLRQASKYSGLLPFLLVFAFFALAAHAAESTFTYIVMEKFDWKPKQVGLSLAVVGICIGLVQGVFLGFIIKKLGNMGALVMGLSLYLVGNLLYSFFLHTPLQLYLYLIPYSIGFIAGPAMQGIFSNKVPATEQGELQGTITSTQSLMAIIGPLLMTNLFSYFTTKTPGRIYYPEVPFAAAVVLIIISAIILGLIYRKKIRRVEPMTAEEAAELAAKAPAH